MGMISPENRSRISRALVTLFLISLSPIIILALLLYLLWGITLDLTIWLSWRKQVLVFVYSNSPTWKDYIEREILPHIRDRALILNWSERKRWKNSLAVLAFRYFGGRRNFNPMAIVFRPFRFVKTYRFFEAFHEFKHGDSQKVDKLKRDLFGDLEPR